MDFKIALAPGDGIGPEVVAEAVKVLKKIEETFGHHFAYSELTVGGASIDKWGVALTEETLEKAKQSDSVLLGAVGGPKWEHLDGIRPEQALLGLREGLGLFTNLRPATMYEELKDACPLKDELVKNGFDILIVRELTGGIYFGKNGTSEDGTYAYDTEEYSEAEIRRVMKVGIQSALLRDKKLTIVDKANILETSRLWRKIAEEMLKEYPEITYNYLYVDNASMQLVKDPAQFDVIVTSNMFGDILSDEASMLTGSIGMLPSASLGEGTLGMYEPIHGSAPDIAGKGIANPLATILSVAMMLEHSFGLKEEAKTIENAVKTALKAGFRTGDLLNGRTDYKPLSTSEMGDKVIAFMQRA